MAKLRILVADDEQTVRKLVQTILNIRVPQAEVILAKDADEAIAKIEAMENPDELTPLDLVITDARMPFEQDGMRLIGEIRDRWPNLGVILMSSEEPRDHGANRFVPKPFRMEDLMSAVRQFCI